MKQIKRNITALVLAVVLACGAVALGACKKEPPVIPELTPATVVTDLNERNRRTEVLEPLDNDFRSRTVTSYANINGKTVDLYTFYRDPDEAMNNPNFSQALLLLQCIRYKEKHPEQSVRMSLTSFHLSVVASACLDPNNPDYGRMKSLYDRDYTSDGYYRLSYLLVLAAQKGIDVTVVGHLNGAATRQEDGTKRDDYDYEEYFLSHMQDPAANGKTVADYMTMRKSYWTSYGDQAATDMMHVKSCTVSHRTDNSGNDHGPAVWLGSTNVDGLDWRGSNSNNSIQTGVIITEHEELRRVILNYTLLMSAYCKQEQVDEFRNLVTERTTAQSAALRSGETVPADEQIVYIGTPTDSVFELYFTPFGGSANTWDTVNNPYCKYLEKLLLLNGDEGWIEVIWNNVKFSQNFELADIIVEVIATALRENPDVRNNLHLQLPGIDTTLFEALVEGENIGECSINEFGWPYHTKDLQLSYVENGVRTYVTLYNSLNFHQGSMSYQSNTCLVVKETAATGNHFYIDYAILTTPGIFFEGRRVSAGR
ncbi:MAG: hypothetical protein IJA78_04625 [Clostridia bacterium]|nr:hypothetical protein [Clostridia bacterium]